MKDLISIVIPVYNVERYVSKCIESVIHQTYNALEIILVDDGSKDDSGQICDQYAKEYKQITAYHKKNGGLSDARNYGMKYATGNYIMFIDSDDYIEENMIELLYDQMISQHADVSVCGYKYVYEDGSSKVPYELHSEQVVISGKRACELIYEEPYDVLMTVVWNKLYNKSLLENISYPAGKKHEDDFTTYKIMYPSQKVVFINEPLYCYLQRSGSIMADLSNDRIIDCDILQALEERSQYLLANRDKDLAGITLLKFFDKCIDRYDTMKKRKQFSKEQCEELRKWYRKVYPDIWKTHVSIARKIYYGIFCFVDDLFLKKHFQVKFKMYPEL